MISLDPSLSVLVHLHPPTLPNYMKNSLMRRVMLLPTSATFCSFFDFLASIYWATYSAYCLRHLKKRSNDSLSFLSRCMNRQFISRSIRPLLRKRGVSSKAKTKSFSSGKFTVFIISSSREKFEREGAEAKGLSRPQNAKIAVRISVR